MTQVKVCGPGIGKGGTPGHGGGWTGSAKLDGWLSA